VGRCLATRSFGKHDLARLPCSPPLTAHYKFPNNLLASPSLMLKKFVDLGLDLQATYKEKRD
jgi:hypothetical protein